ncbi:zinc finger and BTB domain-containing protein 17-like [Anopheles nili]|uniref:zinc finger and BTB domain-containing protein 17-like n=1 Tax=Anopheles nili TaxID=185578 RepID=UPI00237BC868|nr:zinc finger and BTB domain-containing protein 17-like [Anopheles nili]
MGFSDNRGKMSDLNLLPKKHTNFSIERILLKPPSADGSPPVAMAHSTSPRLDLIAEQKVDMTVKTCFKLVQSVGESTLPAGLTSACTVTRPSGTTGTPPGSVPPGSPTLLLPGERQRPLNRVLDNPWCPRGPLMFDPKLISAGPGVHCAGVGGAVGRSSLSSCSPRAPCGDGPTLPGSPTSRSSTASSVSSLSSPSSLAATLVKAEVERKVVLSAYANNSVIERNRLSINYPYPVGLFNAYASAAAVAAAAATVSSAHFHHHHHQQQQQQQQQQPDGPIPATLLPSVASPSASAMAPVGLRSAAAILANSAPATTPLAASAALLSSLYQLRKSDENQNSIFDVGSADEGASDGGTTGASDGGKDSKQELLHAHHLHHHHHHLHHHHEPGTAGSGGAGSTALCSLMYPDCSYQCAICDKIFGTQDTLMSHEKSHKTPRFECEECGKGFSQLRNYKYHVSVHRGTKEFAAKCPECGKMFNDKGYLSSHLKIHRNKKEYSCPHCPKSFNQRVAFNMHVRIHTGVKPHKCNECGKRFSRKMLLKQHLRTHSGEKPYQCSVCGKSFADRSNMTLHHRLHSGIKPFACPICPKAFTKKHHLKTHLNYHTGYKPYKCPHPNCGQSFTQSSNMRTHAKKCQFKPPDSEFV